ANDVSFSFSFEIFIGMIVSAIVGYLAIRFLLGVIRKGSLHYFAYYCWALGAAVLASLLF
ncbi:MAG: undecaprenyl-diphosphate phosphatase, partial [archaeon]